MIFSHKEAKIQFKSSIRKRWFCRNVRTSQRTVLATAILYRLITSSTDTQRLWLICLRRYCSTGGKHYTKQHRPPNFSFTPFKRGELIWSWQSNLTAKISTSCCYLLLQCSVPPAYLSARVITLVTLEALLVLVRLLMLYEGIAFMKHSITIATLLALFNVGMLLSQMNT